MKTSLRNEPQRSPSSSEVRQHWRTLVMSAIVDAFSRMVLMPGQAKPQDYLLVANWFEDPVAKNIKELLGWYDGLLFHGEQDRPLVSAIEDGLAPLGVRTWHNNGSVSAYEHYLDQLGKTDLVFLCHGKSGDVDVSAGQFNDVLKRHFQKTTSPVVECLLPGAHLPLEAPRFLRPSVVGRVDLRRCGNARDMCRRLSHSVEDMRRKGLQSGDQGRPRRSYVSLEERRVTGLVQRVGTETAVIAFRDDVVGWRELDIPQTELPARADRGMRLAMKLFLKEARIVGFDDLRILAAEKHEPSTAERFLPSPPADCKDRKAVLAYREKLRALGVKQENLDAS